MGGASGRHGGQLSGAARARGAAKKAVGVRVVERQPLEPVHINATHAHAYIEKAIADAARTQALEVDLAAMQAQLDALGAEAKQRAKRSREALADAPAGHTRGQALTDAEPSAQRMAAAPRVVGTSKTARRLHSSVARGEEVTIKPKATYRNGYEMDDVYNLCARIKTGSLTLAEVRRNPSAYKVPRKTLEGYLKPRASDGAPKWLVMRDEQRITTLPKGVGPPHGARRGGRKEADGHDRRCRADALPVPLR